MQIFAEKIGVRGIGFDQWLSRSSACPLSALTQDMTFKPERVLADRLRKLGNQSLATGVIARGEKHLAVVSLKLGVARVLFGKRLAQPERRLVMPFSGFDIGAQHVARRVVGHEE